MNADDKSKLKAYEELIGSLEHTNRLQHRVIETQSSLIKSLEEHNAELEKIIDVFFAEVKCRLLQNAMYVGCCKIDLGGYTPKPL